MNVMNLKPTLNTREKMPKESKNLMPYSIKAYLHKNNCWQDHSININHVARRELKANLQRTS